MIQSDDNVSIDMERIMMALQEKAEEGLFSNYQFSIYRVPIHIRNNNVSYYEPRMVSIGPYHRGTPHLHAMEVHKWRYLNEFIKEKNGILEKCVIEISNLEAKSHACYFEYVELEHRHFVEMMLLDSSFIINLFIKWYYNKKEAPLDVGWASPLLVSDLLMLENQIPFFILTKVYGIYTSVHAHPPYATDDTDKWPSFITLVEATMQFWLSIYERHDDEERTSTDMETGVFKKLLHHLYHLCIPKETDTLNCEETAPRPSRMLNEERTSNLENYEPKHLLDIFYRVFIGTQISDKQRSRRPQLLMITSHEKISLEPQFNSLSRIMVQTCQCHCRSFNFGGSKKPGKMRRSPRVIPSAIELEDFGMTLKKKKAFKSLLDISFKGGILEVPCFTVEEHDRARILNLIAFEQCNDVDFHPIQKPLASYAAFLACLMNASKDVILVEKAGIIENNLANSEEGARFFHQIRECAHIEVDNHYLKQLFVEVNDHCHAFWPKHKAKLKRDYFSSPWTVFSLGAALLVLSMTVFQFVVSSILTTFFHKLK